MFMSSSRNKFTLFYQNSVTDVFVGFRPPWLVHGHPDGHRHDVSIKISINLDKTFLRISRIRNILLTWILARVFVYLSPCISQILDFIYWTVLIFFFFDQFEWRDTKKPTIRLCSQWKIRNLRWRRFRRDDNFNRTWRHDLCNIAHALAHHITVVPPSATWNWSVWRCGENVSI